LTEKPTDVPSASFFFQFLFYAYIHSPGPRKVANIYTSHTRQLKCPDLLLLLLLLLLVVVMVVVMTVLGVCWGQAQHTRQIRVHTKLE